VVTVVGARPQFVKASVVSRAFRATAAIEEFLLHTGQHYDENMSGLFFRELDIPEPDCHLGIGSASHGAQTGRMVEAIERTLLDIQPDWVLVYGDTNSTLAGALAAVKLHVPVAHVEAGLRSFNRRMPEEVNRVLTDHVADLLFAPTETAVKNLATEGIVGARVALVGDVMYDAALHYGRVAESESRVLQRLGLEPEAYVLATIHRAENTDDPARLAEILAGLAAVASHTPVVLPAHPRTKKALADHVALAKTRDSLRVIDAVGYLDMLMLEKHARAVATDSGGVQKESFFFQVPCVTLREETEWVELVELGWNRLVGQINAGSVEDTVVTALRAAKPESTARPYGEGHTASEIVRRLGKGISASNDTSV
jgi:UDP-GlcNAc3NAcA epimerase